MSEVARIEDQLRRAFEGGAWHGPAVSELLTDVSAAQAAARPAGGGHSIWEIVNHVAAWHDEGRRRVSGEAAAELRGAEDWPPVLEGGAEDWSRAREVLDRSTQGLLEALKGLDGSALHEAPAGSRDTRYFTLHGIVQHTLYHAGQIAVLKRLGTEEVR